MAYHGHSTDGGSNVGNLAEYSGDERESRSGGEEQRHPDLDDLQDKPIYLLEHLATFTVNKDSGIVYPADGMRRLLQLEKTTGIWSQKMQLCLDYKWVLIMDYESGNVIERFPATLIQEPTAFTSTDAMELYNNILVFIVSGGIARSEMHIFQSQSVSAVHLVEDLKNLRNGKLVTQQRGPTLAQQQQQQHQHQRMEISNSKSMSRINTEQQHFHHSLHAHAQQQLLPEPYHSRTLSPVDLNNGETDSEHGAGQARAEGDETSSIASDVYERDVSVLNHCFDDIEKFIARLQHAAAALRELERRRRNRKTKKKDPGEGLLTLRTRPPHEKEFIDIFAKFKLSFNLLAKLKAHIHDPNAPELVHFLFTPLALIVEASSDTYYEAQLPACVATPLLTRDAINLLINCVTSKETELWRSLGDAWIVPRDQWKHEVGSYHPVFLDGWSPDYLVVDELEPAAATSGSAAAALPSTAGSTHKRRLEQHQPHALPGHMLLPHSNGRSALAHNFDDYEAGGGGMFNALHEKYTVYHGGDGTPPEKHERELSSVDAEHNSFDISAESADGGVSAIASAAHMQSLTAELQNLHARDPRSAPTSGVYGRAAELLTAGGASDEHMREAWLDELQSAGGKIVLVTYPRTANNDKELSVVRGEYLEILDDTRKWWKARNIRGQVAHVPHTIVTPYNYPGGLTDTDSSAVAAGAFPATGDRGYQQPQPGNNYKSHKHAEMNPNNWEQDEQQHRATDTTDWIRSKHLGKKGEFRYF